MKALIPFLLFLVFSISAISQIGNVGIGTAAPLARLHVTDSSVLFSAAGDLSGSPHVQTKVKTKTNGHGEPQF